MLKMKYHGFSDETGEELFVSLGMPRNLARTLLYISQIDNNNSSKKEIFCLNDKYYIENEYNVFIYDTCRYPPNSDSHKTLN